MTRLEALALALAADAPALRRRLEQAASDLRPELRARMRGASFDLDARTLTGAGLRLRWQTRRWPGEAERYDNQQTSTGIVLVELPTPPSPHRWPAWLARGRCPDCDGWLFRGGYGVFVCDGAHYWTADELRARIPVVVQEELPL